MSSSYTPSKGYVCPFCRAPHTEVRDSRSDRVDGRIRRRRYCETCACNFSTLEVLLEEWESADAKPLLDKCTSSFNSLVADYNALRKSLKARAERDKRRA